MALGLTAAFLVPGCSDQEAIPQEAVRKEQAPNIIDDVATVIEHVSDIDSASFDGVDLAKLQPVGRITVKDTVDQHPITFVSEDGSSPKIDKFEYLYADVQADVIGFANTFPKLDIPIFNKDGGTIAANVAVTIETPNYPVVVVEAEKGDFMSELAGKEDGAEGVSFRPKELPSLKSAVSFVRMGDNELEKALAFSVEACQASLIVTTDNLDKPGINLVTQEVLCNSLGAVYAMAKGKFSYAEYVKSMESNKSLMHTSDGQFFMPMFLLPEVAYNDILAGNTPASIEGITLARAGQ